MTTEVLDQYLDPAYVYKFDQGPERVVDQSAALQEGLNCVALAHLVLEGLHRSVSVPRLGCYEMFRDNERFTTVPSLAAMQQGDLVWFGRTQPSVATTDFVPIFDINGYLRNWRDSPVTHVAIYTGVQQESDGDYTLLHATDIVGTNAVWPLQQFSQHDRYQRVRRISRLVLQ